MTILLSGAGSGGHITPLLAVASELKKYSPNIRLVYAGHRGDELEDVVGQAKVMDKVYFIRAGKLRRYHGEGLKQLLDVPTLLKNIKDVFWLIVGIGQAYRLLGKIKPSAIFMKGSLMSVPVGWAAALRGIPYVTHDSDSIPGLANRLVARWAAWHAVGWPKELYSYSLKKTVYVGVPVAKEFQLVDAVAQQKFRSELGIDKYKKILYVSGGGRGSLTINEAVAKALPRLLERFSDLGVLHITGRSHQASMNELYDQLLTPLQRQRTIVKGFVDDTYRYSGAANLVITRAGATSLAEFALQAKACIVVPNPILTGGHQSKNAAAVARANAAIVLNETELENNSSLANIIIELLEQPARLQALAAKLATFAKPNATEDLTSLILKMCSKS